MKSILWAGDLQPGRLLSEALVSLLEALGPTYIKIGQILSARPDLLPPEIIVPLARLQDQIKPFDTRCLPRLIEEGFGRPLEEVFAAFDFTPVASASIAQVHRARLKDDREVAVKIRRPGIVRRVRNDLRLLSLLARLLSVLPGMRTMPLEELLEEVGGPLQMQLDLRLEAEHNRRFREHFSGTEHIKFPSLIEHLCTESIMTMEFLADLKKVTSSSFSAQERKIAALSGLRALYRMIFTDGFIHADMHPGNVFLRQWGEFVILDTGLVARLSQSDLKDFVDFFFGLVNNDGRVCAQVIIRTATYRTRDYDEQAFVAAMMELIARYASLKSHEFEITRFVYQLIETQRRFGIRGSTKFMMTILSMAVFDGICKQLFPECDFQSEARGYIIIAKYRRLQGSKQNRDFISPPLPAASGIAARI